MKLKKIIIVMLILGCICSIPGYRQIVETAAELSVPLTMVVDAGHGGMDGGAIGADDTREQTINLDIAKALKQEAERYGVRVVLTRETENGLYENGEMTERWSKVGDMKRRKQIIEETNPDVTISIHLNSFISDTTVHGAQVFYPKEGTEEQREVNKKLAEGIQESLKNSLSEGGDRIVLPKSGIYLFKNVDHPMILIECGFLSNSDDLQNLKTSEYQQKIAGAVMNAVAGYFDLELPKKEKKGVVDSRTSS